MVYSHVGNRTLKPVFEICKPWFDVLSELTDNRYNSCLTLGGHHTKDQSSEQVGNESKQAVLNCRLYGCGCTFGSYNHGLGYETG